MSKLQISYTNSKGQIVIPKSYRMKLNIDENVALLTKLTNNQITIIPIRTVVTERNQESISTQLLERTRGAWGQEISKETTLSIQKRNLELAKSAERKQSW